MLFVEMVLKQKKNDVIENFHIMVAIIVKQDVKIHVRTVILKAQVV